MKNIPMTMAKMTQHASEKYEYFNTSHQNVTLSRQINQRIAPVFMKVLQNQNNQPVNNTTISS